MPGLPRGSVKAIPPPPALFFLGILAMEALHILLPGPRVLPSWGAPLGVALVLGGLGLHWVAFRQFRRMETTLATLASPRLLVTDGPFRFSRNPMYAAGVLILTGLGMMLGSLTPLGVPVLFWMVAWAWYIRPEEALLLAEFGEDYLEYRSRVRRWF